MNNASPTELPKVFHGWFLDTTSGASGSTSPRVPTWAHALHGIVPKETTIATAIARTP